MSDDELQEAIAVIANKTDAFALTYRHRGHIIPEIGNQPDLQDGTLHFRLLAAHLEAIHRASDIPRVQLANMALTGAESIAEAGEGHYQVRGGPDGE
jgi:hypothetical protein